MDTYDPASVTLAYAGGFLEEGAMDGTHIEVARNEDSVMLKTGNTGESAVALNKNKSGTIKVTVMQTSSINNLLSAQLARIEAGDPTAFLEPIMLKDLLGTTLVSAAAAWPKKYADVSYGKEIVGREWTLECADLAVLVGGAL